MASEPHNVEVAAEECDTIVRFSDKVICLPSLPGMTECSRYPGIMEKAGAQVNIDNQILGIYVTDLQYKELYHLDDLRIDDYFKVFVTKAAAGTDAPRGVLDYMANEIAKNSLGIDWKSLQGSLEDLFIGVEFGHPVQFETYRPHDNILTTLYLIPFALETGEQYYNISAVSFCLIKNRLINVAYYLEYNGEESVRKAKSKSDYYALRLVDLGR